MDSILNKSEEKSFRRHKEGNFVSRLERKRQRTAGQPTISFLTALIKT